MKISPVSILNSSPRRVNEILGAKKFSLRPGERLEIEGKAEGGFLVGVALEGEGLVEDMWGPQQVAHGEAFSPESLSQKIVFRVQGNKVFKFLLVGIKSK